jgi:acetyltransferase-like isoleucine patch superfamily enzyme
MFGKRRKTEKDGRLKRIEECITTNYPAFRVGRHSYGCPRIFEWGEGAVLEVGAFCSIADEVKIFLGGEHRTDWISTYPFNQFWEEAEKIEGHPHSRGDVVIGNDVWIGYGATILSGVRIGHGAVIGAYAVVGRDVEPYTIVAGNPAKVIRPRFDDEVIAALLDSEWWAWPEAELRTCVPLLMSGDAAAFIAYVKQRKTA